jgi:hypothetical protein
MLLAGMPLAAQYRNNNRTDAGDRKDQVFDRTRNDLSNAEHTAGSRADYALKELSTLQQQVDRGTFDRRQFNQTIRAVQQVANERGMAMRTWDALSNDASRLRVMEVHRTS